MVSIKVDAGAVSGVKLPSPGARGPHTMAFSVSSGSFAAVVAFSAVVFAFTGARLSSAAGSADTSGSAGAEVTFRRLAKVGAAAASGADAASGAAVASGAAAASGAVVASGAAAASGAVSRHQYSMKISGQ